MVPSHGDTPSGCRRLAAGARQLLSKIDSCRRPRAAILARSRSRVADERTVQLRLVAEPQIGGNVRDLLSDLQPLFGLLDARVVHERLRGDVKRASEDAYERFLAVAECVGELIQGRRRIDVVEQCLLDSLG